MQDQLAKLEGTPVAIFPIWEMGDVRLARKTLGVGSGIWRWSDFVPSAVDTPAELAVAQVSTSLAD